MPIKLCHLIIVLLLSFFSPANAQDELYPEDSLSSPRDTMNFFLKTMKGFKTGDKKAINLAIKAIDKSNFEISTSTTSARIVAIKLINSLDRIEKINVQTLPDDMGDSTKWTYKTFNLKQDGKAFNAEISMTLDEDEGQWLFSAETNLSITAIEHSLNSHTVVAGVVEYSNWLTFLKNYLPSWTGKKTFFMQNGQWLAIFLMIFIVLIIERISRLYVDRMTQKILIKKGIVFDKKKQKKLVFPFSIIIISGILMICVRFLELDDKILAAFLRMGRIVFTFGTVLLAHKMVDTVGIYFENIAKLSDNKFDDILLPLVRKTSKFFVFSIGALLIGDSFNLDMKSILAGMGIGGIAFALAAKDTISNIFGSLTVLIDRPFSIGDWVLIGDKIEGTVEEVGLRSTRIRTFYDSLITVPNGLLTNIHIDNYGKRTYRRFTSKIGLQYDTPAPLIEKFCEGIRQIIAVHPATRKDYFHVYFSGMGASSLEILIYVFWKVPDWSQELQEKHRLLLDILRLGESLDVKFAFPTQTLHLYQEEKQEYKPMANDLNLNDLAKSLLNDPLAPTKHRSGV